jgi:hypothetical protein
MSKKSRRGNPGVGASPQIEEDLKNKGVLISLRWSRVITENWELPMDPVPWEGAVSSIVKIRDHMTLH